MSDPTYEKQQINANPIWRFAFLLSEIDNDNAPLGWGKYIWRAECILSNVDITWKKPQ